MKKKKKRKHFSSQHHDEKLTGNSFFVSFRSIRFFPFPFPFNTNTKKDQSGTPFAFLEKKIPPLVRGLDHQTIESFVFLLSSVFCPFFFCAHSPSSSFRGFMYIGMYM